MKSFKKGVENVPLLWKITFVGIIMKIKPIYFFLILIIILSGILRVYHIDKVPVSLYWDETAQAYNAYSIAKTGKDEYGNFLPILFRSFDDYKMPGTIYLTAVIVKFFGLSEVTARIPSALAGTLTVLITFFFVKQLLTLEKITNKKTLFLQKQKNVFALIVCALLAISPWHIQFSRTGFEANIALLFVVLGIWLLLKGIRQTNYLIFSSIILALSFYFYRSVYVFLPPLLLIISVVLRKELLKKRKPILISSLIFFIIFLPILFAMLSPQGLARSRQVSVTNQLQERTLEQARTIEKNGNRLIDKIVYNRRLIVVEDIIGRYLSHFNPQFLFFNGDGNGRHEVKGMGQLYKWEIPFFVLGLILCWLLPRRIKIILFAWFFLAPLPASFSIPTPHALRSLNMLPIPQIFTGLGILFAYELIKKNIYRLMLVSILTGFILCFFLLYLHSYYVDTPALTANDWADGYKQLVLALTPKENSYSKIIVSGYYWQPYIYFLFYKRYDPEKFQKSGSSVGFDNYYFGGTSWDKDKGREGLDKENLHKIADGKKTIVALAPEEFASEGKYLTQINAIQTSCSQTKFYVGELK